MRAQPLRPQQLLLQPLRTLKAMRERQLQPSLAQLSLLVANPTETTGIVMGLVSLHLLHLILPDQAPSLLSLAQQNPLAVNRTATTGIVMDLVSLQLAHNILLDPTPRLSNQAQQNLSDVSLMGITGTVMDHGHQALHLQHSTRELLGMFVFLSLRQWVQWSQWPQLLSMSKWHNSGMTGRHLGTSITAFPRECDGKRFIQCLADEILYYVFSCFTINYFMSLATSRLYICT